MALPPKPAITTPPAAPSRGEAPATFATKAQAFVNWQAVSLKPNLDDSMTWIEGANTDTGSKASAAAASASASANSAINSAASATQSQVFRNQAEGYKDGAEVSATSASVSAAAAQSAVGLPSLVGRNGHVLTVNDAADGVSWQPVQTFGAAETFILGM